MSFLDLSPYNTMVSRTQCGIALAPVGGLNVSLSEDMKDVVYRELKSGREAIPRLERNFTMVMKDLFETELLSIFYLRDPYAIFSGKIKANLVGSVSEGFGLPEYIHWGEDSSSRVTVRDEADFNLVWGWLKLEEESPSCSSTIQLDGLVEFSSYFPGYAMIKLVANEAITRWIDLSNIAINCDGSKVEVYLHPSAVTDEFYMSLHLRSVLSNLIVNSIGDSDVENANCYKSDNNFEREGSGESSHHDQTQFHNKLELSFHKFSESASESGRGQKTLFLVDEGGPAINVAVFSREGGGIMLDMALCLSLPSWPTVARGWISRHRPSGWPSQELVSAITSEGCSMVPVSPLRSQTGLEWRISFSLAEKKLAQSLNDCQKACYLIVKGIWRHYLKHPSKRGLQSYHLKTILFWACEELPPGEWRKDKIGIGVLWILQKLHCFLVRLSCPQYFIPENNLFQDIEGDVLMSTLQRVSIAILSRQQVWYNNPGLLTMLPPENSRMHLTKLEDQAFLEAIESVYNFCFTLALHKDEEQAEDFEKMMACNVKEALEKCLQSQRNWHHLIAVFFAIFEKAVFQQYWDSFAAMRRYLGGRIPPRLIALKKPIPLDLIIKLCAWLDMFKFSFKLFVNFVNEEGMKDLINQENNEELESSEEDCDSESTEIMGDLSHHVLSNLTQAFMETGEFDLEMASDDESEVDEEFND
ncbi:uncharacterized protein LOC111334780 [Stylophora pistillata]|nr:uncharacterized protein LOC111334780 [Stylophora pistillata]